MGRLFCIVGARNEAGSCVTSKVNLFEGVVCLLEKMIFQVY